MSDETPDTTGLREHDCEGWDSCPNPAARPDPTPEPDTGDVEVPYALLVAIADPGSVVPRLDGERITRWTARAVLASDWLANRVAAAREADHAEVERLQAEADYHHARADLLRAKLSTGVALRGGKPGDYWAEWHRTHCAAAQGAAEERARAETAERRLAGLVAKIEALVAKWSGCWCGEQMAPDHDPRVQDCPRHGDGAADHFGGVIREDLAGLIPADAATALDAVREGAKAEALREFADTRGVNVGDEDDEWWRGYRQAQRECLHAAATAAARHTPGSES